MAVDKRTNLNAALKTQLQLVNGVAPYETTLTTVDINRTKSLDNSEIVAVNELPAAIIRDPEQTAVTEGADSPYNKTRWLLRVEIELITAGATPEALRQYVGDIYYAIGTDTTLGGYAETVDPVSDRTLYSQEDRTIRGSLITVLVTYSTRKFQKT